MEGACDAMRLGGHACTFVKISRWVRAASSCCRNDLGVNENVPNQSGTDTLALHSNLLITALHVGRYNIRSRRLATRTCMDQGSVLRRLRHKTQCHAEGSATKGGVSKCEQTQTNADKRRGKNASKRKQTRANIDKCKQTLTPPFIAVF